MCCRKGISSSSILSKITNGSSLKFCVRCTADGVQIHSTEDNCPLLHAFPTRGAIRRIFFMPISEKYDSDIFTVLLERLTSLSIVTIEKSGGKTSALVYWNWQNAPNGSTISCSLFSLSLSRKHAAFRPS